MKKILGYIHDLTNKLTIVKGNANKLTRMNIEDPEVKERIGHINQGIQDITELVAHMKEYETHRAATTDHKGMMVVSKFELFRKGLLVYGALNLLFVIS